MKIVTVVGARPQFIKAAAVSRVLRKEHREILVHTGQHYDYNMSDIFFEELHIPKPDINLGISGGTHGKMTGQIIISTEEILLRSKPEMIIVYGDTNSTLAAALAAVKLHIPVCHIESGGRLGTLANPEEVNRICTDHVSSLLMCCVSSAVEFLKKENITENVFLVGDPMYDAFLFYSKKIEGREVIDFVDFNGNPLIVPEKFYFLTCHRQENTDSDSQLIEILNAMNSLDYPVIYPVHPRNNERVNRIIAKNKYTNILFSQPVGYLTSIMLVKNAVKVVTDSGGVQREAFFSGVPCVTIFDYVVWPETMVGNQNQLAKPDKNEILRKLDSTVTRDESYQPFGDGHSAEKITKIVSSF